ncbi:hypothetical protein GCM10010124_30700 [Pilimelia terevasa]|uniref:Integrase catalytic domain-containing protein n=1 Tax=Pilimelia terevasa TaxID=53372 RepID=A0A8J3FJ00_9ACTN|nr:hypothetical protein GCM10010124_30700 [Pilimelia terevasa]
MRRAHQRWGARRISFELSRTGLDPGPSRATVHRVLVRNGLVDPHAQQRKRAWNRWERDAPMQLWQLDIVDGMRLPNGRQCKIVTGLDDHSRFAVVAAVVARPTGKAICAAFTAAMDRYGEPEEVLTDNGKQFTGRHTKPMPVEVLFERICRQRGIVQRLTKIRSPTTTGKVERFHHSLQQEFLNHCAPFPDLPSAQAALDGWVDAYNTRRPHQSLDMATPATRFHRPVIAAAATLRQPSRPQRPAAASVPALAELRAVELHLSVPPSGALSLAGRQLVWVGKAFAGRTVHLWADQRSIHLAVAGEHLKTVPSRLSIDDLHQLTARGGRAAGPTPAASALHPDDALGATAVQVHRTANRDGNVQLAGQRIQLGADYAGQRITLRMDGHLLHVIADDHLARTLPSPVPADQRGRLVGAQRVDTPLPPPRGGAPAVRRRVPADGVTMVAGQRLRIGRVHAGKTVTIAVEDTHYRAYYDGEELGAYPQTGKPAVRVTRTAHRAGQTPVRPACPDNEPSTIS